MRGLAVMRLRDVEATRDQAYDAIRRKANAAEWGRRAATAIQGGDLIWRSISAIRPNSN